MDIEERCDKALAEYIATLDESVTGDFYFNQAQLEADFKAGYMAGVAQTQRDYSAFYSRHV